jgi:hypothetical protein
MVVRLRRLKPAAPATACLSTADTGDLIAELVERGFEVAAAGETAGMIRNLVERAANAEALVAFAAQQSQLQVGLIHQMAPVVQEFPRVAEESIGLRRENTELEHRGTQSELMFERAVALMTARDIGDFEQGDED